MIGYKYNSEKEAIAARKKAADFKKLPVPNGETLYWVNYNYSELDGFWYINYVGGLEAVLGEPIDITITPDDETN
jgi:hypothetical protein